MTKESTQSKGRPFLGVHFECCGVYARIHLNKKGSAYVGWCPKCTKKVEIKVGADGTSSRFFRAR